MTRDEKTKIPVCPKCSRKTVYFRKDGSLRCTACGYDAQKVEK